MFLRKFWNQWTLEENARRMTITVLPTGTKKVHLKSTAELAELYPEYKERLKQEQEQNNNKGKRQLFRFSISGLSSRYIFCWTFSRFFVPIAAEIVHGSVPLWNCPVYGNSSYFFYRRLKARFPPIIACYLHCD